jgi:hypothetical protein
MLKNEIEQFRKDFFDKVVKYELERDRQLKEIQLKCYHHYNIMGMTNQNGYQERTCSKCGHSAIKSVRVWEGTKQCTIA